MMMIGIKDNKDAIVLKYDGEVVEHATLAIFR